MQKLNNLSITVLSHNRLEEIQKNIPYYLSQIDSYGFELVIVDNNSSDGTKEYLSEIEGDCNELKVILNDTNLGVADGRNIGREYCTRNYILHLDDDTELTINDIVEILNTFDEFETAGVVTPRIVHAQTGLDQNYHGNNIQQVGNYHGACHMVYKKAIEKVGNVDSLCSFGGEEIDYSIRLMANGYTVIYNPNVVVKHNNIIRTGGEGEWRRQKRVYNFSRLHFKHFPYFKAIIFTIRYFLSHAYGGIKAHGVLFLFKLCKSMFLGIKDGVQQHSVVPDNVVRYYSLSSTRPDFGNVPILQKIKKYLIR